MQVKNASLALIILVLIASALFAAPFDSRERTALRTYFSYTEEELAPLYKLHASKEMNHSDVDKWDRYLEDLFHQEDFGLDGVRIAAYIYAAQREAAFLSYNIKQRFEGSLDPVSNKVLALFVPNLREKNKQLNDADAYSQALADIVGTKFAARFAKENQRMRPYPEPQGEQYWKGKQPYRGVAAGSWQTWLIESSKQFQAPLPPPHPYISEDWVRELAAVKVKCHNITAEQKEKGTMWAGLGPKENERKSDWRYIAKMHTQAKQHESFPFMLTLRAVLQMGISDASAACYNAKYTYWVKRPSMADPNIKPFLDVPNHPSYPSAHSTVGGTCAVLLSYFFPENIQKWDELAEEAGMSRIWCGIHYPMDHRVGLTLGREVGEAAVQYLLRGEERKAN